MDEKTLKYMGTRVDKARRLKEQIEALRERVETLPKYHPASLATPCGFAVIGARDSNQLRVAARTAVVQCIQAEIVALEKELAEL